VKVAVVTSFPRDPSRPVGGVEAVSVVLVRALAALDDLDVHVVTTDASCSDVERTAHDGATLHRLPRRGRWTLTDAIGPGRRAIQDYLERLTPDVIHAHDVYGLMVKGLALPRVFTIHGFIYADTALSAGRLAGLRSRLWRRIETGGWADQPHIVSISPYVRERLSGIAKGIIHDIDNPIAESFFRIERRERRGVIFCAALINARKNTLTLVEALAHLREKGIDAELRLAGAENEPDYARRVRQRIGELGLQDRVKLLGSISGDQVRAELAAANIFALVSLEEGSPMGIEEAMAAGVPVVASNRCGMPYMIRDGETGFLIDPNDPQDVAWRLAHVLQDDERRAAMGVKAQQVARDRFHPAVVAARTREVYRRAVRNQLRSNGNGRARG
jgi:glycosyltransferase involved in cell wall biosynthesis